MDYPWYVPLVIETVLGCAVLCSYAWNRTAVKYAGHRMLHADPAPDRWLTSAPYFTWWAIPAVLFGALPTLFALVVAALPDSPMPFDTVSWCGLGLFFLGAISWSFTLPTEYDTGLGRLEACSLFLTAFGLVVWATRGTTAWSISVGVAAIYHIVVDLCIYTWWVETRPRPKEGSDAKLLPETEQTFSKHFTERYASWQGMLAMMHYAFAFYVAAETSRATAPFKPPIELSYNQWVKLDDTKSGCDDTVCVVHAVSTDYGKLDIGYIASSFSWISGTHHALVYLGLYSSAIPTFSRWVKLQIGLSDRPGGNALRAADYALSAPLMLCSILLLFESPGSITSLAGYFSAMSMVVSAGCQPRRRCVAHTRGFCFARW